MKRDQAIMEAAMKAAIDEIYEKQINTVNGLMKPEYVDCSYDENSLTLSFPVLEWELNRVGVMHGGIIGTAFDIAMGILTRFLADLNFAPTINLETIFIRPIPLHDQFVIHVKTNFAGRTLTHLYAEGYVKSTGKLAATAKSSYLNMDTNRSQ